MNDLLKRYEKSDWQRRAEEDPEEHWKRKRAESLMQSADPELYALYKRNQEEVKQLVRMKTIQSFLKIAAELKQVTGEIEQLVYQVIDSAPQSMVDRMIFLKSSVPALNGRALFLNQTPLLSTTKDDCL